jgi:[FeFe] hydrogenase (group B1/B3)
VNPNNDASRLRRQLLEEVAKVFMKAPAEGGRPSDYADMDRVAVRLFPREQKSVRCCIYRDRAIVRYRILAQMGFGIEDEVDEASSLAEYAVKARARAGTGSVSGPYLTVIDEACNSCLKARYMVTNLCQACLARPCARNCPKEAIAVDRRAAIDEDKCVNCGLCMLACPYHAIVKLTVPCEEACPVEAIAKDESGNEHIDYSKCVHCGKCMVECPFGAIMEKSQMPDVLVNLKAGKRLVAIYAPAVAAQFTEGLGKLGGALAALGFADSYEVAAGAEITAQLEAEELAQRIEKGEGLMTTSCCPAYYEVVRKHLPELASRVSSTRSPMYYAAELAKREAPDALVVFIGPCVAKKREGRESGLVDYVLNAEELGAMLVAAGVDLGSVPPATVKDLAGVDGRGFPVSGGVAQAVRSKLAALPNRPADCRSECLNGLDKKGMARLKLFAQGKLEADLLEVMACEGGCIAGPAILVKPKLAAVQLAKIIVGALGGRDRAVADGHAAPPGS